MYIKWAIRLMQLEICSMMHPPSGSTDFIDKKVICVVAKFRNSKTEIRILDFCLDQHYV